MTGDCRGKAAAAGKSGLAAGQGVGGKDAGAGGGAGLAGIIAALVAAVCCCLTMAPLSRGAVVLVIALCALSGRAAARLGVLAKEAQGLMDRPWKKCLGLFLFAYFNIALYGAVFLESDAAPGSFLPRSLYVAAALPWTVPLFL